MRVVSEVESRCCHSEVTPEAMRIEQGYGITKKEEELLFHRIDTWPQKTTLFIIGG